MNNVDLIIEIIRLLGGGILGGGFALLGLHFQGRQNMNALREQHKQAQEREDKRRQTELAQHEEADRQLVREYAELLLFRIRNIATIVFLGPDNYDQAEGHRYKTLKPFMLETDINPSNPENCLAISITFLMFQLIAAMRLAVAARFARALSDEHRAFLDNWERRLEPIFSSRAYPGNRWLCREQVEVIGERMLIKDDTTAASRPMHWQEFTREAGNDTVLAALTETVRSKLASIFDDGDPAHLAARKEAQCRLAIMALYLIELMPESERDSYTLKETSKQLWDNLVESFASEWKRPGRRPNWYVFQKDDLRRRAEEAKKLGSGPRNGAKNGNGNRPRYTNGTK